MRRRGPLLGGLALSCLGGAPASAETGSAFREFRILRGGTDIGRHRLDATLGPEGFCIAIDIDIRVGILGITAHRYALSNREVWKRGHILMVSSETNEDGDLYQVTVQCGTGGLVIDGTRHSGTAPIGAVTSSYFARPFIERRPWLSTQSGQLLDVEAKPTETGTWSISGDLKACLDYDARGEWIGCRWDARGESMEYQVIDESGLIGGLWAAA